MTQRVDLATVMDRLAVDDLITGYAAAVDDSDWTAYRALFAPDGRADYRGSGGIEGPAAEVADWLAETMTLFPVRQHLIVNRRVHFREPAKLPGNRRRRGHPRRLRQSDAVHLRRGLRLRRPVRVRRAEDRRGLAPELGRRRRAVAPPSVSPGPRTERPRGARRRRSGPSGPRERAPPSRAGPVPARH